MCTNFATFNKANCKTYLGGTRLKISFHAFHTKDHLPGMVSLCSNLVNGTKGRFHIEIDLMIYNLKTALKIHDKVLKHCT